MVEIYRSSFQTGSLFGRLSIGSSSNAGLNYMQKLENSLTLKIYDYYESPEVEVLNSLYKAISPARAEQLLNAGVDKETAIATAVSDYVTDVVKPLPPLNPITAINDPVGIYQLTGDNTITYNYDNKKYAEIETGAGNDTISISGTDNPNMIVDAGDGTNIINIDDTTTGNVISVTGGTGYDRINLQGNIADYTTVDNGDGTLTLTNSTSGTQVTIDALSIDKVYALDGVIPVIPPMVINGTPGDDNLDMTVYNGKDITLNGLGGNDTVALGAIDNNVVVNLLGGNDTINVDDTNMNTFVINAGGGYDTVSFTDNLNYYSILDNGDGTYTISNSNSGASTTISDVEKIVFTDTDNNAATFAINQALPFAIEINAGNNDDNLTFSGANNNITANLTAGANTITLDDTVASTGAQYTVNGGTDTDTINLTESIANYTFEDNQDGTLTLTNNVSNVTLTVDANIETINFGDGSTASFDGAQLAINNTMGSDTLNVNGNNTNYNIIMYASNDNLTIDGSNNTVYVELRNGDDNMIVKTGNNNQIQVNGNNGTDTITLEGDSSDWTYNGIDTYTHNTMGTSVQILAGVENINFTAITINGTPGDDNLDTTGYSDMQISVNGLGGNDTVSLGGTNNTTTVNLAGGDDTINVDDTAANTFTINAGAGTDTVNMAGNMTDYTFLDNGDGTLTLTRTSSGATTTIDSNVETLNFADSRSLNYNGTTYSLNDAAGQPTTFNMDTYNNSNFSINAGDDNDTINLAGTANTVTVDAGDGNDIVNINDLNNSTYTVAGGAGADRVNLSGNVADYTQLDNGDGTITLTNTVSGAQITVDASSVEEVYAADGQITMPITINGTPGDDNLDTTGYSSSSLIVNGLGGNDTVSLGGSDNSATVNLLAGDDTVNVDDTAANTFNINAGAGTDTVNMAGNLEDYTFQDNGSGKLTLTRISSGATTTIDANVETVNFADSRNLTYNGTTFTVNDAAGQATIFNMTAYNNSNFAINAGDDNDTINLAGTANTVMVDAGDGDDIVNINDLNNSTYTVNGGAGTDRINLSGNVADYSMVVNGDNTVTLTNTVSGAQTTVNIIDVEEVYAADGQISLPIIINGTPGDDNLDATAYTDTVMGINGLGGNDTVSLGGTNNTATANLLGGNDTINIDDTNANRFIINAGAGTDTVNMTGNFADYTFLDNGDGTLTLTRTSSGATTTISSAVEQFNFADSRSLTYDGTTFTINDAAAQATTFNMTSYNNSNFAINAGDANDTINLGGTGNTATVSIGSGVDIITIDDSQAGNTFVINGDGSTADADSITFNGAFNDYNFTDNGDGTITFTRTLSGSTTTVNKEALGAITFAGSVTGYYDTSYDELYITGTSADDTFNINGSNARFLFNTGSGVDTINVSGSGNYVYAETGNGADIVNFDGTNNTLDIDFGAQNDQLFVARGSNNQVVYLDGGTQTDTLNLQDAGQWTLVGDTYTHNTTGTSVKLNPGSFENINYY